VSVTGTMLWVAVDSAGAARRGRASGVTTCGPSYVVRAGQQILSVGGCAGIIGRSPTRLTVATGGRFEVQIAHEQSGRLDFPVPVSSSLTVRWSKRSGSTVTYLAERPGVARLVSRHTRFCAGIDPKFGSCTALLVDVTAR
jgi:hypothetical protein